MPIGLGAAASVGLWSCEFWFVLFQSHLSRPPISAWRFFLCDPSAYREWEARRKAAIQTLLKELGCGCLQGAISTGTKVSSQVSRPWLIYMFSSCFSHANGCSGCDASQVKVLVQVVLPQAALKAVSMPTKPASPVVATRHPGHGGLALQSYVEPLAAKMEVELASLKPENATLKGSGDHGPAERDPQNQGDR